MILNEQMQEMIDRYLMGKMSAEEKRIFEIQMAEDKILRDEISLQKDIISALHFTGNAELKQRIAAMHSEPHLKIASARTANIRRIFAIAAILIVFITAAIIIYYPEKDSNDLYALYYAPYDASILTRGNNASQLEKIADLYEQNNYAGALTEINIYFQSVGATNAQIILMKGICELETGKPDDAAESFESIISRHDPFYSDQATWYLALLEIKEGKNELAVQHLKQLNNDSHADHHKDAESLLNEIR